jgi:hypothetical protein
MVILIYHEYNIYIYTIHVIELFNNLYVYIYM